MTSQRNGSQPKSGASDGRSHAKNRHAAREDALQMLYHWEVGRVSPEEVLSTFAALRADEPAEERQRFAESLVQGTVARVADIDPMISEAAQHWRISRMAIMDRLIMRMAVFELLHGPETPPKVVINEALELARRFSTEESVKFVNGVLDAIRKRLESLPPSTPSS